MKWKTYRKKFTSNPFFKKMPRQARKRDLRTEKSNFRIGRKMGII